jgi:hypothetical protein
LYRLLRSRSIQRLTVKAQSMKPTIGRSHDAVIRVYDDAGNVIETHDH